MRISEKRVNDMSVRAILLLLATAYFALDNTPGVAGVCSSERVYRRTCPGAQSTVGALAELGVHGELVVQVALSPQAKPYGTAWRVRVQWENLSDAPALLALARPCGDADDSDDTGCLRAVLPALAARPGQRLWVWVEKLARSGELGCSFCEANRLQVLVLGRKTPARKTTPSAKRPSPPTCAPAADLGAVVAVGVAAGIVTNALVALACLLKGRRVTMLQWLHEPKEGRSKFAGQRTSEEPRQVRGREFPRRPVAESPPPPPPPKTPSAPPATPSPPPAPPRGPLLMLHPPPEAGRLQFPPVRPLPPLPPRETC